MAEIPYFCYAFVHVMSCCDVLHLDNKTELYSPKSDQLELVERINEENKRRKRKRIVLTKLFVETCALALAFVTTQRNRGPRDIGTFNDDEDKIRNRKYLLKCMYDGSAVACYDQLRLTK